MPTFQLPPPPPEGFNYIAAIKPSLTFILVVTPLGSVLVPVLVILLFFFTSASRRRLVFILNIFACILGLAEAFLNGILEVKQILYPLAKIPQALFTATVTLAVLSPVIVDSILLTRVLAFYPRRASSTFQRLKVLAFPILVKFGRFAAVVLYLHQYTVDTKDLGSVLLVGTASWPKNPYITAEWTLQMVDNAYSSLFFLMKLRVFEHFGRQGWVHRHPSLVTRIRGLFYIAVGNFIFPVILNIAQIVLISTDPSFENGTYILLSNNYVSIIGVVFATIWTYGQSWRQSEFVTTGSTWNQGPVESDGSSNVTRSHRLRKVVPVRLPGTTGRLAPPRKKLLVEDSGRTDSEGESMELNRRLNSREDLESASKAVIDSYVEDV